MDLENQNRVKTLTGVQLRLSVYHAVEPEFKDTVNPEVYDDQIGMIEMFLNVDEIIAKMSSIRNEFCKFI